MANLTISTLDVLGATVPGVRVIAEPTDENGDRMAVYQDGHPVVATARGKTDTDGTITLDLIPQADLDPTPSYYTVWIGDRSWLIVKGAGEETLLEALIAEPTPAGSALTLSKLQDVDTDGAAAGKALVYDADGETIVPGDVATPTDVTAAVDAEAEARQLADQALDAAKVDADGGVLVSDLDADGNKVTGLADGAAATDAVSVVQVGAKVSPISPHHGLVMSGWTAAIAEYASDRPLRVMVISDSMGELGIFGQAFETIHLSLVGAGRNRLVWWGPSWAFAGLTHTTVEGTASDIGIDQRGRVLTSGDQIVTAARAGTVCAVRYTSRPGGGTFTIAIDGGSPVSIDTSDDENGDPVAATTPGQVMRVTDLDYEDHTITIECTSGEVWIEATAVGVPEGLQVVGIGRSGESTQGHIDAGQAVATLEADVARGEAPDLIILASDTGDLVTAATVTGPLTTLLGQLREHAPDASYLLWIPPDHQGASDWPAVVAAMRGWAIENDVAFVDTYHGLGGADGGGDWSNDSDPKDYSDDGVHPAGAKAIYAVSDLLLGALWSASRLQAVAKVWSEIDALDSAKVNAALFGANTILKADADNTPKALTVGEDTLVGRVSGGDIDALTVAEARSLLVVGNQVSGKVLISAGSSAKTAVFSTPFSFADLTDGDQFEAEFIVGVVNASGGAETVKVWATLEHDTDSDQELVTTGASDLSVSIANNVLRKLIHVRVRGVYTVEGAVWSTQTTATIDNGDTIATNVDSLRIGSLNSGYTLQFYTQLSASSAAFVANGRAWARRIPVLS